MLEGMVNKFALKRFVLSKLTILDHPSVTKHVLRNQTQKYFVFYFPLFCCAFHTQCKKYYTIVLT